MGGSASEWFDVRGGVQQGCVLSPLLFNIYMDFVVKQALAQMPEGCGMELAYHDDGKLQRKKWGKCESLEVFVVSLAVCRRHGVDAEQRWGRACGYSC